MYKAYSKKKWLSISFSFLMLVALVISLVPGTALADDSTSPGPYFSTYIDDNGNEIGVAITPVRPPKVQTAASVSVPDVHIAGVINSLSNVPAFDWSYGCSATSAAMLCGYYDRHGYGNMYTGPTNSGVCPLDNSAWGYMAGEMPMSASHDGYDGRTTKGHVDDYWSGYLSTVDPYYNSVPQWAEHTPQDCLADFMGTSQYHNFGNVDGSTSFYFWGSGSPFTEYYLLSSSQRDGAQGVGMYAEYCGYTVNTLYTQLIPHAFDNYYGNTDGFTFDQFKAEIDAGYPVLIHVEGHTMLGYGYQADGMIYIHDTWNYTNHTMAWGGSYAGMDQWGVSVIHLAPPGGYYQIWWLDSETDASGNPVMENIGTQSGSVPLEDGNTVIWKSNAPASGDVVFNPGTWTVCLNTTDLTGDYSVEIGESEGGVGFSAFNDPPETGSFHSPLTVYITLPSVTVPAGHNLALRVTNTGTGSVITNAYTSYVGSPLSVPSYPVPELASGILAGLGFVGLAAFVAVKRRQNRTTTH